MTESHQTNTKFRVALRRELPRWVEQGLISEESAARLRTIYQLENLREESSRLLSSVIFAIGGLLLVGGLTSLVAANWEEISDSVKLALLFTSLLALHTVGYWLWHNRGWPRLGRGLIVAGCLLFGANIGLIAQIFHIQGDSYGAFGAFALGSLVMAWAIRSWPIGLLVLFASFIWFFGFYEDNHERAALVYPLALAVLLVPLAWKLGSRALYAATAFAIVSSAFILVGDQRSEGQLLLALAAGGVLLWTAGELHRVSGVREEFAVVTSRIGLSLLAISAYIWSFRDLWDGTQVTGMPSLWPVAFLAFVVAGSSWLWRSTNGDQREVHAGVLAVGATLVVSALLSISFAGDRDIAFAIVTNLAAFVLAGMVIRMSLIGDQRALFWLGSLYVVLLILSRFIEYEASLLLRSLAFLACGVAVIIAGIRYEQYRRRNDAAVTTTIGTEATRD